MKLKNIVTKLRDAGHSVTYRVRKDGSIVIQTIDGKKFTGKSGNAAARALAGVSLSLAQQQQLAKIALPKGSRARKKKEALPQELKRHLQRVQRKFRKMGLEAGKPTTKNVRWVLRNKGYAEAERRLTQAERYARGIAYPENVKALAETIWADAVKVGETDSEWGNRLIRIAEYLYDAAEKDIITEDQLKAVLHDCDLYDAENGSADWRNAIERIELVLGI